MTEQRHDKDSHDATILRGIALGIEAAANKCSEMIDWPLNRHPCATLSSEEYVIGIQRGLVNAENEIRSLQLAEVLAKNSKEN